MDIFIAGKNQIDGFESVWVISMGNLDGLYLIMNGLEFSPQEKWLSFVTVSLIKLKMEKLLKQPCFLIFHMSCCRLD